MDDILKDLPMVPAPDGPHRIDIRTPLPAVSPPIVSVEPLSEQQ